MPKQISRLLIAFTLFISLFLVLRHFLKPKSFGLYGHYRADALIDNASKTLNYADTNGCIKCHKNIDTTKRTGAHKLINCQNCHGPGNKHILDPKAFPLVKPATRSFCGRCHHINKSRPAFIKQVDTTKHNINNKCTMCHNPHSPMMKKPAIDAKAGKDDPAVCIMCHAAIDKVKKTGKHKPLICQACHGSGKEHINAPAKTNITKPSKREFCGGCHSMTAKSDKTLGVIKRIDLKEHNPEGKCVDCHIAHNPLEFK